MALADILADHPDRSTFDFAELHRAIQACVACMVACNACADSDLSRDPVAMRACIRRTLDCADICAATARVLSRPAPSGHAWMKLLTVCAMACAECAEECGRHEDTCCQECATACRECEQACQQLVAAAN